MVTQNRTCLSQSKGHKCTGSSTRTIHCPKLACPGDVCALDTKAVTNLVTGKRLCGVGLPQDPVLQMPLCTTTTKKATTRATTKTTKKPTTKTPALPCFTHYASSTKYANCAAVGAGFKAVGGSCYKAIYVNADYAGARAKCKAAHVDADLATIRCDAENTGASGVVSAALKTQCLSFGEFFHSQLLLGINNVTRTSGISWTNGANTTYRNWAPGEPNGSPVDAVSSATLYIASTNPAGGVTYPLGKWENTPPDWVVCAALCEVITAKTGTGCGLRPCTAATKTTTTKKTTTTTTTTTTTPALPCVTTSVPTTTYADCAAVGGGFIDQMLLGINNVTTTSGVAWSNGANSTYRNWAPGEPNGNSPAETDAASSATFYIASTDPAGGTYPLGQWENMLPTWVVCATLCEVITAKTGNGCGFSPCQNGP
ncbi:unnamed protein product, partial [Mesorhabditis belari]|uniref:C-type lectin domain-containing protein n=1 Tax=Mesorhabditis belari TaxID=2138241 RepID=A0AAF3EYB7_9BILA